MLNFNSICVTQFICMHAIVIYMCVFACRLWELAETRSDGEFCGYAEQCGVSEAEPSSQRALPSGKPLYWISRIQTVCGGTFASTTGTALRHPYRETFLALCYLWTIVFYALQWLDGKEIGRGERIQALQELDGVRRRVLEHEAEYLKKREKQKNNGLKEADKQEDPQRNQWESLRFR